MDLRGLCSKIDLDSIRAKFPHMPALPTMPPIKLPKSMPKLKSRKIFRASREDVNKATPKQTPRPSSLSLRPIQQPAEFINHTPTRISTISSLMQQHTSASTRRGKKGIESDESFERNDINTYRSAHSIDDDYPSSTALHGALYAESPPLRSPAKRSEAVKQTSPHASASNTNVKMSLGEKLQKGYKDLTEFRFKHLLSKKTVVRSDNIEVDYYVQRYNEDRLAEEREQKRRDREISENYRFKFKETRQSSTRSYSMSPFDSPITARNKSEQSLQRLSGKAGRTVGEQSGDESGMETTPPMRGVKHSHFPRGRSEGSMSDDNELGEMPIQAPISSSLWAIKEKQTGVERSQAATTALKKGHKERMRRLTSYISSHEESGAESANDAGDRRKKSKLQKFGRHGHVDEEPNVTETNLEEDLDEEKSASKPLDAFKKNLKRFKSTMSIKRQTPTEGFNEADAESGAKIERSATSPTLTRGEKLTARLRRFKTREVTSVEEDEASPKKKTEPSSGSPLRTAIANKLQTWKMSFKKKPEDTNNTGDEASPEKQARSSTLKDKLRYIRSRKNPNAHEDREGDNEGGTDTETKKSSNLEEKFVNARQRTLKRVNDKMQKIKFFHKSQDNVDSEDASKTTSTGAKSKPEASVVYRRRAMPLDDEEAEHSSETDDIEEIPNRQDESYSYASTKKVHAVWTTRPILSDSTESEDNDVEYPRVVIHQDESDLFESTLIIAVTTAAAIPATPPSPTPKITEIITKNTPKSTPTRPKALNWIAKKDSAGSTGFSESLSPNDENGKLEWIVPTARGHARKLSMDSNSDSDSWIAETIRSKQISVSNKEETRRTSAVGLNSIQENEEPWRVHAVFPEEKIYRAPSIDIFAENVKRGAFEDFDDELKNEPVLKITIKSNSEDKSFGKDSSEDADAADDDNSSRVTKVRVEHISEETLQVRCRTKSPEPIKIAFKEQSRQIGNSRESLDANFDENEEYTDDEDDYEDDEEDRPPSAAPSPPPMSPPPPPLPQRQSLVPLTTKSTAVFHEEMLLPPLPATRPPIAVSKLPPKIPERTESMSRIAKPLVKTSSLRLAYSEQVKPADVGKVNKLISRFEQPNNNELGVRPRMRQRALMLDESEDYSDYEEKENEDDDEEEVGIKANQKEFNDSNKNRQETTPTPPKKLFATQAPTMKLDEGEEETKRTTKKRIAPQPDESMLVRASPTATTLTSTTLTSKQMTTFTSTNDADNNKTELLLGEALERNFPKRNIYTVEHCINIPKLTLTSDLDNNNSQTQSKASSEYGSPLEYPSSLIGSTETTPTPGRRQQKELRPQYTTGGQRRARSMARDDDQYYSFDSDEENSYYSISSTGSSRYIVEI